METVRAPVPAKRQSGSGGGNPLVFPSPRSSDRGAVVSTSFPSRQSGDGLAL